LIASQSAISLSVHQFVCAPPAFIWKRIKLHHKVSSSGFVHFFQSRSFVDPSDGDFRTCAKFKHYLKHLRLIGRRLVRSGRIGNCKWSGVRPGSYFRRLNFPSKSLTHLGAAICPPKMTDLAAGPIFFPEGTSFGRNFRRFECPPK